MSEDFRGRQLRPRVTRRPSPGLAARMKMLEADAEKRNSGLTGNAAAAAKLEIARSGTRTRDTSVSGLSDHSGISIAEAEERENDVGANDIEEEMPPTEGEIQIVVVSEDEMKWEEEKMMEEKIEEKIEEERVVEESGESDGEGGGNDFNNSFHDHNNSDTERLSTTNSYADLVGDEHLVSTPNTFIQDAPKLDKDLPQLPIDDEPEPLESNNDITEPVSDKSDETRPPTPESQPAPVDMPSKTVVSIKETHRPSTASPTKMNDSIANTQGDDATATAPAEYQNSVYSHAPLQRRASVFSLSRISFSSQLSRLTSLTLPLSSEFSDRIKKMKTSREVSDAITSSAKQILRWIETAKTVLRGLDAEDDVEWAAQGKESLTGVDGAVNKFSGLMQVYVSAIEELQSRKDANDVGSSTLLDIVTTMEIILDGWNDVQGLLKGVKAQVETAMEWTELWTTILQDIQAELETCQTIVFEIEERRHRSMMEEGNNGMDIDALATIVEDPQPASGGPNEDSSLLGLFARMQPLRASLDFLPMRLASFQSRAENIFPGACEDLESRRKNLEKKWKKLESDAEEMKKELGEDKWVTIFRNAAKQAMHMIESVERSLSKLRESIRLYEDGAVNASDLNKRVESYEAKRTHYGPAIQRVLAIIDKGVNERLTVNGEILRLHTAMQQRWKNIEHGITQMDEKLEELNLHSHQLRDSVSTIASDSRSPASGVQTPGSSPASSVVLSSPAGNPNQPRSASSAGHYKVSPGSRYANTPPSSTAGSGVRPKISTSRTAGNSFNNLLSPTSSRGASPSPALYHRNHTQSIYHTPSPPSTRRPSASSTKSIPTLKAPDKPKWNISVNTNGLDTGHHFKPLSLTTPSQHRKQPIQPVRNSLSASGGKSRIPMPSPLSYGQSPGASPMNSPTYSKFHGAVGGRRSSMLGNYSQKSPGPSARSLSMGNLDVPPRPELRSQHSMSKLNTSYIRPSIYSNQGGDSTSSTSRAPSRVARPASALAGGRRLSMLPRPRSPLAHRDNNGECHESANGTNSSLSGSLHSNKRNSMPPQSPNPALVNKPRWKG